MFKRLRIKHKAGSDQQSLTLPISDFIGLWGCATGTIANIHLASDGAISSDAKFIGNVSSYISCLQNPPTRPDNSFSGYIFKFLLALRYPSKTRLI